MEQLNAFPEELYGPHLEKVLADHLMFFLFAIHPALAVVSYILYYASTNF